MFLPLLIGAALVAANHQPATRRPAPSVQDRSAADAQKQAISATFLVYRLKEDPRTEFVAPGDEIKPPAPNQGNRQVVVVPEASMLLTEQNEAGVIKLDQLDAHGCFLRLCTTAGTRVALGRWLWEPLSTNPTRSLFPIPLMTQIASPRLLLTPGQSATLRVGQQVGYMVDDGAGCFRYVQDSNRFEGLEATIQVSPAKQGQPGDLVVDRIDMTMSWIEQRQPIPGVALDVGAPVKLEEAKVSYANLAAAGCNNAFLFTPRAGPENERFIILLLLNGQSAQGK